MATAEQVKALVRSIKEKDEERFYRIALQIAASANKKGQARYASDLTELIEKGLQTFKRENRLSKLAEPKGELADLMHVSYPQERLSELMLTEELDSKIKRIIFEQNQRGKLYNHSLRPKSKILLAGDPGTGKTMTASVLASELKLPLFVIKFEGLISRYLGETAAKLKLVFEQMDEVRGVYFFDEFDTIGTQREVENDVGEARRIVSSFLQFLEQDDSNSIIIAATNHKKHLDRALFRRFDDILIYAKPDAESIKKFINNVSSLYSELSFNVQWKEVVREAKGLNYSDIESSLKNAIKWAILNDVSTIDTKSLIKEFRQRHH